MHIQAKLYTKSFLKNKNASGEEANLNKISRNRLLGIIEYASLKLEAILSLGTP